MESKIIVLLLRGVIFFSILAAAGGQTVVGYEDQGYFYAPTSTDITWSPIQPKEIKCLQRPVPEIDFANKTKITGKKFTHTESRRAHGYLCTKSEWSVTCSEGFFGGRSLSHTIRPSLPTLSECFYAIREYRTNHNLQKGYPAETCGWMSTNTETTRSVHITETLVELDPYNLHLLDPRFIGGVCMVPPCTLTTMDTLWINSSKLELSCDAFTDLTLYVPDLKTPKFFSPSLISDTIEGSCTLKLCGESGIRLNTGEWIKLTFSDNTMKNWADRSTKCPDMKEVTDISLIGIIAHLSKIAIHEERYRLCIESKERINSGERTSRIDLAHIAPSGVSTGPVYRLRGNLIEVGISEYKLIESPVKHLVGAERDILGYDVSTNKSVYWEHWVDQNASIRDGPNGIVMVGEYLVNPLVSLDSPGRYRQILETQFDNMLRHPALSGGTVGHLLDISYDPKNNPKSLTKVVNHWWGSWSFSRWFWILITLICGFSVASLYVKWRSLRRSKEMAQVQYIKDRSSGRNRPLRM